MSSRSTAISTEALARYLHPSMAKVLTDALSDARRQGTAATLLHILQHVLLDRNVAERIGEEARKQAAAGLSRTLATLPAEPASAGRLVGIDALLSDAIDYARSLYSSEGEHQITPLIFLQTVLMADAAAAEPVARAKELLRSAGISLGALPAKGQPAVDVTFKSLGFGTDLTLRVAGAGMSCPLIGMERELGWLVTFVTGSPRSSIALVGEPGVGKSSVVYGLAWHLANQTRPLIPRYTPAMSIVEFQPQDLVAGTSGRGDLEERLRALLNFFAANRNVVPFFDEMHRLFDTSDPEQRVIATALKPAMATGQFRCIGCTTDREYARYIVADGAINSRFNRLLVSEPDEATTVRIVENSIEHIVQPDLLGKMIAVPHETVKAAVKITNRYVRHDRQPRKTIQLIRTAAAFRNRELLSEAPDSPALLRPEDVSRTFSDMNNIPLEELSEDRRRFVEGVRERLAARVVGQADAVDAVCAWLKVQASGWQEPGKPRARFLFIGPSGVGKTALAAALAEIVMRDKGAVITRNLADFSTEGARNLLMGSNPGYIGFGETSTIYSEAMMRPYSLVLLENIDRGHAELLDPLLNVLDGTARDAQGRTVDFSQCIFVLTMTVDRDDSADDSRARASGGLLTRALLDRIDAQCVFQPLSASALDEILQRAVVRRRGYAATELPAELSDPATRKQILDAALADGGGHSARNIDRELTRWLAERC